VFGTGISFVGFRAYDKRFTAGIDAFTGVYAAYRTEGDVSLLDLNFGMMGVRFSVGYRF
jgi:hypothetical protein